MDKDETIINLKVNKNDLECFYAACKRQLLDPDKVLQNYIQVFGMGERKQ